MTNNRATAHHPLAYLAVIALLLVGGWYFTHGSSGNCVQYVNGHTARTSRSNASCIANGGVWDPNRQVAP